MVPAVQDNVFKQQAFFNFKKQKEKLKKKEKKAEKTFIEV